jgi:hypothetical protein
MQYAIALENRLELTKALQDTVDALANLSSNPAEQSYQANMRSALDALGDKLDVALGELSAADVARLDELGASNLFPNDLYAKITEHFNANVATPSVTMTHVQQKLGQRSDILDGFRSVVGVAEGQQWNVESGAEGDAEVGFTIPREIFENKLKGLTKEMEWVNRFISSVTEASTGQHEEFEVSRLSTSNPTVYIATTCLVAITFGKLVTWALDTWKSVEEIRHLRAQTSQVVAFKPEEIESFYGEKIKQQVKEKIEEQATALVSGMQDAHRKNELHSGLSILLEQFLQRVERGMTVDIRLIGNRNADEDTPDEEVEVARAELNEIASALIFPSPSEVPVLQLTGGASGEQAKRASSSSKEEAIPVSVRAKAPKAAAAPRVAAKPKKAGHSEDE